MEMGPQLKVSSDSGEAVNQNCDPWFTPTSLQLLVFENKLIFPLKHMLWVLKIAVST